MLNTLHKLFFYLVVSGRKVAGLFLHQNLSAHQTCSLDAGEVEENTDAVIE